MLWLPWQQYFMNMYFVLVSNRLYATSALMHFRIDMGTKLVRSVVWIGYFSIWLRKYQYDVAMETLLEAINKLKFCRKNCKFLIYIVCCFMWCINLNFTKKCRLALFFSKISNDKNTNQTLDLVFSTMLQSHLGTKSQRMTHFLMSPAWM